MPASLFMIDSMRSPNREEKNTSTPKHTAARGLAGHPAIHQTPRETAMELSIPPRAPSTVFLGEMSVSLVRPTALPARRRAVRVAQ
jgi:hypothetical protein